MKFKRTSSAGNNNDITFGSRYNINEISTILSETNFLEWKFVEFVKNEVVLDRLFNYRHPLSAFDFSKKNIICNFDDCTFQHNMNIVYRKCCINDDCPVRFRVEHCTFLKFVVMSILKKKLLTKTMLLILTY